MNNQSYLELIEREIVEFCKSNTNLNFEELSKYFKGIHANEGKYSGGVELLTT